MIPTPYTVTHQTPTIGEDDDGNTTHTFTTGAERKVYGWAPHTIETRTGQTYVDTWDVDLYMPKTVVNLEDRIVIDGVTYEVVDVADWTNGFHQYKPGIVVGLKKWEG